jgi:hypothetical protein
MNLQRALETEAHHRESQSEIKAKEISKIRGSIGDLIERELRSRKESEARMYAKIDEFCGALRSDLAKEQ